jgi:peptidoglycan-associated lipoprotein
MKKVSIILAVIFLAGCAAATATSTKDFTCPAPLAIPVEKVTVIEPVRVVPAPVQAVPRVQETKLEIIPFYFAFDKSNVKPQAAIERTLDILSKDKSKSAELQGNCDQKGSAAYNLKLGDRRAKEVKALLVKNGVDQKRLSTISFGKKYATGNDAKDRRVDIVVK